MPTTKPAPVKVRRKFDKTFKLEAVNNWLNSGKSAEVIAQELGLTAKQLYAWKQRLAPADAGGRAAAGAKPGSLADMQAQLDAALRENRHLREQRDILKKTLGILSEPSPSAMNGSLR
jgi:transposase-like protein